MFVEQILSWYDIFAQIPVSDNYILVVEVKAGKRVAPRITPCIQSYAIYPVKFRAFIFSFNKI
jgi:hypothetical protein